MSDEKSDRRPEKNALRNLRSEVEQYIIEAVQSIRYGAVEIVIHDGNVVQIERREKLRVEI